MPEMTLQFPHQSVKNHFIDCFMSDYQKLERTLEYSCTTENSNGDSPPQHGNEDSPPQYFDSLQCLERNSRGITSYKIRISAKNSFSLSVRALKRITKDLKESTIQHNKEFIQNCINDGIEEYFSDGNSINIADIEIEIVFIKRSSDMRNATEVEKTKNAEYSNIFEYCRLLQGIPTADPPYRRIKALIFDIGQKDGKRRLIGAICISSSNYFMQCRDEFLCWESRIDDEHQKQIRDVGLKQIVQLSFCMSINPYSNILGNKLLAALVFSEEFLDEFYRRYHQYYLAVVATCFFRARTPVYEDINFHDIDSDSRNDIYTHIGELQNYSTIFITEPTFNAARKLIANSNMNCRGTGKKPYTKKQLIAKALSLCNISSELLKIHGIGIYLGYTHDEMLISLRQGMILTQLKKIKAVNIVDNWRSVAFSYIKEKPENAKSLLLVKKTDNILVKGM